MSKTARNMLDALTNTDFPDSMKAGVVALAVVMVDRHLIKDPAIHKAWRFLKKSIIEPWLDSAGENLQIFDSQVADHELDPGDRNEKSTKDIQKHKAISMMAMKDFVRIGRLQSSTVFFDHESVARLHAVLEKTACGLWKIVDLGARGGTIIHRPDGSMESVKSSAPVRPGDVLQFGECTLELSP